MAIGTLCDFLSLPFCKPHSRMFLFMMVLLLMVLRANAEGNFPSPLPRHWFDEYDIRGREVPDSERLFPLTTTDRKLDGRMLSGMGMTVSEGNCAVDGFCFSNLNYGPNEDCTWVVGEGVTDGTLEFSQFNVESHSGCIYDYLLISGTKYCGTTAPTNLVVTAGDEIKWHSDESEQRTGFNVCVTFSCTSTCGAGSGW